MLNRTSPAVSIRKRAHTGEAAGLMLAHKIHRLPVVDKDNKLLGIVSRTDIFRPLLSDKAALYDIPQSLGEVCLLRFSSLHVSLRFQSALAQAFAILKHFWGIWDSRWPLHCCSRVLPYVSLLWVLFGDCWVIVGTSVRKTEHCLLWLNRRRVRRRCLPSLQRFRMRKLKRHGETSLDIMLIANRILQNCLRNVAVLEFF